MSFALSLVSMDGSSVAREGEQKAINRIVDGESQGSDDTWD